MLKKLKHRFYNALLSSGIVYNPKEVVPFNGQKIMASKGAFSRTGEKDDAWLFALSQNHSKILDIGCNIGQSSLLMMLKQSNKILCIDPNPNALARCAENLIDNGMINRARFVNAFVGAENDKPVQFYSSLVDAAGSKFAGFAKTSSSIGKSVFINQRTVDSICHEMNFLPDFIKIDVEGAEIDVLNGLNTTLADHKPTIFVEVHSGIELSIQDNTSQILDWALNNKYQAWYCSKHCKLENLDQIETRGRYHILLVPVNRDYPNYLRVIPEYAPLSIFE